MKRSSYFNVVIFFISIKESNNLVEKFCLYYAGRELGNKGSRERGRILASIHGGHAETAGPFSTP